jgi:hypothetical protein
LHVEAGSDGKQNRDGSVARHRSRRGLDDVAEDAEQCRLAATVAAHDTQRLAAPDLDADVLQHDMRMLVGLPPDTASKNRSRGDSDIEYAGFKK